jgi:hypothetical protein
MRFAILPVLVMLCLACQTQRGAVSHVLEPGHDLSRYRTWEWDDPAGPAATPLDAEIRAAVERELAARGYQQADGHWPELRVSYRLALLREIEFYTDYSATQFVSSYHNAGSYEVGSREQRARVYETGTLSLRVDLPAEAKPAWWALQSTRVRTDFGREASRAVAAMFQTFPATSRPGVPTRTTDRDPSADRLASAP